MTDTRDLKPLFAPRQAVYRGQGVRQRQVIETGCVTFDRQVSAISANQVIGGTQVALVIRARTELWNGDYGPKPEGHFQQWDLDHFPSRIPSRIRQRVEELTAERSLMLHVFYHYNGGCYSEHGFIAVQREGDGNGPRKVVGRWRTGITYRSDLVLDGVTPYITDEAT